ncbi:hypothetical protein B0H10DRAFT_2017589 [Mycena sp. CBHHK59/15]|nr:hypothetical protein B0H10DRAFT_2017589 [Mycena sp. CBHHK59/15]
MAALEGSYAVDFPSTDKNFQPAPRPRPPHLPFRRISLPSNPRRESVVSVASFDSLPEEGDSPSSPAFPAFPAVMRNVNPPRRSKVRPMSSNRRLARPLDDAREAKRRKVIQEFYATEKTYVDGLEMIYSHFLTPIIASLDTPQPLLQRSDLSSVFSNFVDIWNLHRAFFASLSDLLPMDASSSTLLADPPPLSPVLLSHFPYLSLYSPFVTAFPLTISSMTNLASPPTANHPNPHYSPAFAAYMLAQEADPRCGKLKLRDWLLSIVQRCPRYLLLLKDLIGCTDPGDPEHGQLSAVHALVSKITLSLNTSIHTHAQTLSLVALQRATPNLPFQLIVPGRTLVRRGPLLHIELSAQPRDREFLLFSDCLVWLEPEDGWGNSNSSGGGGGGGGTVRPVMVRTRSKSEAELPVRNANGEVVGASPTRSALPLPPVRKSAYHHPVSRMRRRRHPSSGTAEEGRWVYKGRAELVDLEVVVTPPREIGEERRFEVLSPEGSFVLYADSEQERNAWTEAIRQTKTQLFVSLNATHPDSTLTSSSSTAHLRRSLQALPFPPSDERLATVKEGRGKKKLERRGRVEHWVPAIWIPDEKTEGCMRCGRTFGWRRRRHHCRLCGRCVCASCSERTFFISDPNAREDSSKPARACNACYETVFPLLENTPDDVEVEVEEAADDTLLGAHSNTMTSLANFPSWLSMPSLPLSSTPEALMAIDRQQHQKYERLRRGGSDADFRGLHAEDGSIVEMAGERVRVRSPPPRPRSYHQILEDFEESRLGITSPVQEDDEDGDSVRYRPLSVSVVDLGDEPPVWRNEDTARRNKRFSLPAVAVQATSVTARTQQVQDDPRCPDRGGRMPVRTKRFSLLLGTRPHTTKTQSEMVGGAEYGRIQEAKPELGRGVAAGKLTELLGRQRTA